MFFRRKKKAGDAESERKLQRHVPRDYSQFRVFLESHEGEIYRGQVDGALVVQVESSIREPVQGRLVDLSIQGVSVVLMLHAFPAMTEGEIVGVRIEHVRDEWGIATPGLVRVIGFEGGRWVRVGLEFVNPGNLFAQLENDRGEYFNRRREGRVSVDGEVEATIKQKGTKVRAKINDLSVCGIGGWVDHVGGATLRTHEPVQLTLRLPDELGTVEGAAELVYKARNGAQDRVGVSFDLAEWSEEDRERVTGLVEKFLAARFGWAA